MTVLPTVVMESHPKRTVRRKVNRKVNKVNSTKKLIPSVIPFAKVCPMPSAKNSGKMPKAPKRRNPSATKVVDDMVSRINGEFSESTYQSPNKDMIKIRRRTPSNSAINASEALLSLKNSAITFDDIHKKEASENISPFLKLPKSMYPNTEISNVTNISHKYSSPSTSPRPKSDSEIEIAEKSKIMVRSDMLSRSISLEEDQDLPYPPPSKKARTKFDDFQLKTAECFLPPGGFQQQHLNNEKKRNDYQSQIAELRAKNEALKAKNEAINNVKPRIVDFEIKSNADAKVQIPREDSQAKKDHIKARSALLEVLECSSCKNLPKQRQNVYGCSQGHLLCQNCVDNVEKCPTCSEKDIKHRSAFAERIMNKIFPVVQKSHVQCRFELCKAELPIKDLKDHETFCTHREVPCPSTHRGACTWNGPLSHLIQHVKENRCVQVIFDDSWYNMAGQSISVNQNVTTAFKSNLGDFPATEKSVFERNDVVTHWKPVLLLSKKVLNLWCHIVIQRDSLGLWRLMAYSMLPKDCTDQINVKITVGDSATGRSFNFSGKLTSYETSAEQATKEGNFLYLHDAQIRPFKIIGQPILFDYSIELEVEAKLISKINLRSQKISMNNGASAEKKICEKDILSKLPKLTPKPAARFNVTFKDNDQANGNISLTKVKVEPVEVRLD